MTFFHLMARSIKSKRLQWLIYCAIGLLFMVMYIASFETVQSMAQEYNKVLESMPKGVLAAFNISQSAPTLVGFLATKHFGFVWPLMLLMMMIAFAGFSIAREIETKTMGLILSQPIRRSVLYLARFSAGVIGILIFIVTTELVTLPLGILFGYEVDIPQLLMIAVLGFMFGLAVLALSLFFSAITSNTAKVAGIVGGIMLIMYVFTIVAALSDSFELLKYFSFFHYFATNDIVANNAIGWQPFAVYGGTAIVTTIAGLIAFEKRDINV